MFLVKYVIQVMENTSFFKGLYTKEEIDMSGLNSREEKTMFLQKSIDVLCKCTMYSNISIPMIEC